MYLFFQLLLFTFFSPSVYIFIVFLFLIRPVRFFLYLSHAFSLLFQSHSLVILLFAFSLNFFLYSILPHVSSYPSFLPSFLPSFISSFIPSFIPSFHLTIPPSTQSSFNLFFLDMISVILFHPPSHSSSFPFFFH